MATWLKLHRKSIDSQVFSDPQLWRLWCWCLIKANWKRGWHLGCELLPGQFATGRHAAAQELGISGSAWYRGMQKLQEIGCIMLDVNNRFTKVSITNWERYQGDLNNERTTNEQQTDNWRATGEQPADTIEEEQEAVDQEEVKEEEKVAIAGKPTAIAPELLGWMDFWRSLKNRGLVSSGVAHNPSKGLLKAWTRVQKSAELQEMLADKAKIEAAIIESPFAQNGNWFYLEKLLGGTNAEGCYIVRRLLDGGYRTSGKNSVNLGAGVNFTESSPSGSGVF